MIRRLREFFIPHEGNEFRPHSLREESVLYLSTAAVLLFAGCLVNTYLLLKTDIFATIVPSVLVDYTNEDRALTSLGELTWNPTLAEAAQEKANDMAANSYFAHTSPSGTSPWYWFKKAGYEYSHAGENLAVYFTDSVDVHTAWMNSPGHRANILNGKFTEIGIALAKGIFQGNETIFVVELFGTPKSAQKIVSSPAPSPTPPTTTTIVLPITPIPPPTPSALEEKIALVEGGSELFVTTEDTETSEEDATGRMVATVPDYSNLVERTLTSPRSTLHLSYFFLFGIIAFALFAGVIVEFRRHHPLHIVYGTSLLVLLSLLYYAGEVYVFSNVSIV